MALLLGAVAKVLRERTVVGVLWELLLVAVPLCVPMAVGVVAGWAWRPRWVQRLVHEDGQSKAGSPLPPPPTHQSPPISLSEADSMKTPKPCRRSLPSEAKVGGFTDADAIPPPRENRIEKAGAAAAAAVAVTVTVTTEDLEHLRRLVEGTDGGAPWSQMMERSLPTVKFRAWRRDPEVGPPEFCTRTVFEDVTPELMRDFFWDDEFRITSKWDDMLLHHEILEECPETGMMIVRWIRKFPFFCGDREYVIGRRIWRCGRSYYCVTKGVPGFPVPGERMPRRVDLYYSSWYIRAVESADGNLSACEVTFFHHEDMGIRWELVKLGARYGMWGTVKKIEPGLRAYQVARESGAALSRYAFMAGLNTEVASTYLSNDPAAELEDPLEVHQRGSKEDDRPTWGMHKLLILGAAVLIACTLERSFLTKAAVFGVAARFPRPGR